MRHAEARDLRSFLGEPVEELVMDGSDEGEGVDEEDITLQKTRPDIVPDPIASQRLRPYQMQRYQSRRVPVARARSTSEALTLPPSQAEQPLLLRAPSEGERVTGQLALAVQKLEPLATAKSWRELYVWLVLIVLFLLVVLGGIGLDSLIATYR